MGINKELAKAIQTLKAYCDNVRTCNECVFRDSRDDFGMICRVCQLIEDERYLDAVKGETI